VVDTLLLNTFSLGGAEGADEASGRNGDEAGFSVAAADVDGDGRPDVVAGALQADGPDNSRIDGGEAYVINAERIKEQLPDPATGAGPEPPAKPGSDDGFPWLPVAAGLAAIVAAAVAIWAFRRATHR
jgi:hypothetical protein